MVGIGRVASVVVASCLLAAGAAADDVVIYRCTDAAGKLSLRDTPCRKGEKQETRSMVRPKDAPIRVTPAAAPVAREPAYEPVPRYAPVPARPMYECIGEDGQAYVSDTGIGRQRFEPNWFPVYPILGVPRDSHHGVFARAGFQGSKASGTLQVGRMPDRGDGPRRRNPTYFLPVGSPGEWVEDPCYALPQVEVCDRLRDERYELNRRWHISQPSERAQIDLQTRSIDARLDNDCGGR